MFERQKVELYSLGAGCPNCTFLKSRLLECGVEFSEITDKHTLALTQHEFFPVLRVYDGDAFTDYSYKEALKLLRQEGGTHENKDRQRQGNG